MTPCKIDGCEKAARRRGWCNMHYERWRRHGSTDMPPGKRPFWSKVDKQGPDGCWLWTGALDDDGYGRLHRGSSHRVAYELLVGPIPEGLHLDHLCRIRECVNPDHLEPVTPQENLARSQPFRAVRIACDQGHVYTAASTYVAPGAPTSRKCRTCRNLREAEARKRKKEAAAPSASPDAA